ncbi:MAG: hypothetical protein JO352_37645 [Chloroflexi bacterium]|nr:hypothetical protein [Chloroflexota bacterium]
MPVAILACIGVLGLVLDIGLFRVLDSDFENAADAAALAAAWYQPVCPVGDPRCKTGSDATTVATSFLSRNLGPASNLCSAYPSITVRSNQIHNPSAPAVSVIVQCNAPYLAGGVLGLNGGSQITRWATAAIGNEQPNGSLGDYALTGDPLIAALVSL